MMSSSAEDDLNVPLEDVERYRQEVIISHSLTTNFKKIGSFTSWNAPSHSE
jgi:hypothetical protein